ncbi:MAG: hypothetical protein IJW82_05940 [Clostridia bacterium]|nr:hypothetical protein [Clostridia bacterium]
MARISNKIKCELMNRLFQGKDIQDFVTQNNISQNDIDKCLNELKFITQKDTMFIKNTSSDTISNEEINKERNKFKKYSWQIIQKANEILVDKLNQLAERERHIDRMLNKIEDCLYLEEYDKSQMSKLIKMLESIKQNSISELARVVQILYDKQDDKILEVQDEETLENLLGNLVGEEY